MTDKELEALWIVSLGPTTVSNRNELDPRHGVRCIGGGAAKELRRLGLIRDIPHWPKSVEIVEAGRTELARQGRMVGPSGGTA